MNELALFAGAGGGVLGGVLLGWTTVCAVEIERYPRECLLQRQRDGVLPPCPIWDDVRTFDGRPWRGVVDVVSGGFPCQDISAAGKGAGIEGARSGLWSEMYRIICEVRPRFAFMENSPMLTSRGLHRVLGDLAEAGYDAAWMVLGAADVGAPHRRERIWILAEAAGGAASDSYADGMQCTEQGGEYDGAEEFAGGGTDAVDAGRDVGNALFIRQGGEASADSNVPGCEEQWEPESDGAEYAAAECGLWWGSEPAVGRVADGVAHRVDRLRALGNGQVPLVAAVAFCELRRVLSEYGGYECD